MNNIKYVCLLRGVNVSGQRKVNMKVLCTELSDAGLTGIEYYLQSGNLIVESELSKAEIETKMTGVLRDNYDYQDVDLFLFDHAQLLHNSLNRNRFMDKIMQQIKALQRTFVRLIKRTAL